MLWLSEGKCELTQRMPASNYSRTVGIGIAVPAVLEEVLGVTEVLPISVGGSVERADWLMRVVYISTVGGDAVIASVACEQPHHQLLSPNSQ